jgi:methionyl-tRNA formyltransferase
MGTPNFAVPTLDALLTSRHQVVGVVTQPDKPRGRGQKTSDAPVKARASAAGVPVLQPTRLKDPEFLTAFQALRADLGVVAAYGKILPNVILDAPRLGMINVHASLLPRYRGAAPVHRAILAGEGETGVTIMRVVPALDAGPMLAKATRIIGPDETSETVERDLASIGATLLVDIVDRLAAGAVTETPQDDSLATYAHRLVREEGVMDWQRDARELHDQVRGLRPWPQAFTFLDGHRYIVQQAAVDVTDGSSAAPGTVIEAEGDRLIVAAGRGALRLIAVQPEGKRALTAREFLAGHRLARGARFSGPP